MVSYQRTGWCCTRIGSEDVDDKLQFLLKPDDTHSILVYSPDSLDAIGLTIGDYKCLQLDDFLNDNIVNFFIKYFAEVVLSSDQKEKTHFFDACLFEALLPQANNNPTEEEEENLTLSVIYVLLYVQEFFLVREFNFDNYLLESLNWWFS